MQAKLIWVTLQDASDDDLLDVETMLQEHEYVMSDPDEGWTLDKNLTQCCFEKNKPAEGE